MNIFNIFSKKVTAQEIQAKFPLQGQVTQQIIDKSDVMEPQDCIGFHCLKESLLPIKLSKSMITWSNENGTLIIDGTIISIRSSAQMMKITEPQKVRFEITRMSQTRM